MIRKAVLCGIALLVAIGPTASAQSASDPVTHDLAVTEAQQKAVKDYWTPSRIAAMPVGDPGPGHPPVDGPDGAGWAPGTHTDRSIGRLFFVDRDGDDASCTATLLPGGARSVVVTAAHCVHQANLIGEDPKWVTNVLFVPGFRDNTQPFGSYVARTAVIDNMYIKDDQRSEYDQAFLALNGRIDGLPQGIAYDVPAALQVQEFGYPRAAGQPGHQGRPEFTGQRLAHCWGLALRHPEDQLLWGVPCDMGGGSSGGPRIAFFGEKAGLGVVVGVNVQSTHRDPAGKPCRPKEQPDCTRLLVGPQFSKAITRPLYLKARGA